MTVSWDNITSGQNGIIQKYQIKLDKEDNPNLDGICCIGVNESRIVTFLIQPAQKYAISVCGYTSYHKCGKWATTDWFNSPPLCKYRYMLYYFLRLGRLMSLDGLNSVFLQCNSLAKSHHLRMLLRASDAGVKPKETLSNIDGQRITTQTDFSCVQQISALLCTKYRSKDKETTNKTKKQNRVFTYARPTAGFR